MLLPLQAKAIVFATPGWQTGFTVTTTSEGLDVSGNYEMTVTWDHTAALFTKSPPNAGYLWATGIRMLNCASATVTHTFNNTDMPTGCQNINYSESSSTSGNNEVLTAVFTIASADLALLAPNSFLVPYVYFRDQPGAKLFVSGTGSPVGGSSVAPSSEEEVSAPLSYTGPKISSLNLTSVAPGGSLVATGKKLDQIQSATIGGKAAALTYSDNGLAITVPADLAPGTYNLVMQTSYGSLTQLNAVVVRTKPTLSSFTLKGTGSAISSDLASEIKAIGSMYSADYSKIHCLVNTTDEAAAAIATKACSLLKTGSLSAATTLTTLKSNFKGSGFWLRIYVAG